MKTFHTLLALSLFSTGCANYASDCERLGTCVPAGFEAKPPAKPLGSACSDAEACESGFCVDGLCCDTACDAACGSCNAAGHCEAEAGRTCDGGICDGGGFCSTGSLRSVQTIGTVDDDEAAPGAILPGRDVLVAGTAAPPPLSVGALEVPSGGWRGFSSVLASDGSALRSQSWGQDQTAITTTASTPQGEAVLAGRFTAELTLEGLPSVGNDGAADAFVLALAENGAPRWIHVVPSTAAEPAHVETLAANETSVAAATWQAIDGQRRRVVQVFDRDGRVASELPVTLGEDLELHGAITALAFDPRGRLWMLAEYRGDASLEPEGGAPVVLPPSGSSLGPIPTRSFVVAFDPASMQVVAGPHLLGTSADVLAGGLAVTGDTIFVGGGLSAGALELPPAPGQPAVSLVSDDLGHDPFILAIDELGRRIWSAAWPSDAAGTTVGALAATPAGDVAFAGHATDGTVDLAGLTLGGPSTRASFVGKLSPSGELLWRHEVLDAAGSCRLDWVGVANDGKIWFTGATTGTVLAAPGQGGRDVVVGAFAP